MEDSNKMNGVNNGNDNFQNGMNNQMPNNDYQNNMNNQMGTNNGYQNNMNNQMGMNNDYQNNMNNQMGMNNVMPTNTNPDGTVKTENMVMGIVGAVIGSLAGVISIIIFSSLGFVAAVSGLIMGASTLFMYEKLAGSISKKGIIICIVVMIIMVVLGENLAVSIAAAKTAGVSFFSIFKNLYSLLKLGDLMGEYIGDLAMLYLFTALGAFGVIKTKLNSLKNS